VNLLLHFDDPLNLIFGFDVPSNLIFGLPRLQGAMGDTD
jgi:hypothetical protein